jgi:membrane associated rhomboid family serine protease
MATCYRHPDRATGVSCSNCGNPICPDCMTPTPVGMRCPDCARQRTPVRTMRSMVTDPVATYALIAINVLLFIGSTAGGSSLSGGPRGSVANHLSLWGPAIEPGGEWWRLVTSGFMHAGLLHLAFNMYALYWLGTMLEPALGRARFLALYFASLLCGSFGVLLLSPGSVTVGASGAVFGLMGAAAVELRSRGINPFKTDIGLLIVLNLAFTFFIPGISIGGHLGGLLGGSAMGFAIEVLARRRRGAVALPVLACAVLAIAAAVASVAVTSAHYSA